MKTNDASSLVVPPKLTVRVPEEIATRGLLAIDPGVSGAFALSNREGEVELYNWVSPKHAFEIIRRKCPLQPFVITEKVHSSGGQGPKQAHTFGKNVGHWEMLLTANGFKYTQLVSPLTWQRGIPGVHGKSKASRKRALYNFAHDHFDLKNGEINPKNADALLIFLWAQNQWEHLTCGLFEDEHLG